MLKTADDGCVRGFQAIALFHSLSWYLAVLLLPHSYGTIKKTMGKKETWYARARRNSALLEIAKKRRKKQKISALIR